MRNVHQPSPGRKEESTLITPALIHQRNQAFEGQLSHQYASEAIHYTHMDSQRILKNLMKNRNALRK